MKKTLVGQIVQHEGKIYQILSETDTLIRAHSYDEKCAIETTIFISKSSMKVFAKKEDRK